MFVNASSMSESVYFAAECDMMNHLKEIDMARYGETPKLSEFVRDLQRMTNFIGMTVDIDIANGNVYAVANVSVHRDEVESFEGWMRMNGYEPVTSCVDMYMRKFRVIVAI
jgi:hypothetical protein